MIRYVRWAGDLLRGDFGISYHTGKPIIIEMKRKIWNTVRLSLAAFAVLFLVAFPLGILSAVYNA